MEIIKFRHKETGHVWDVDQPALAERLDADKDFERVGDAPQETDKPAAEKSAAEKSTGDAAKAAG